MNHRRISALVYKEFQQIKRDFSTLLIAFILPLILLFIYGYGISLDITRMEIGCVMEDRGEEANALMQGLTHSPFFAISFEKNAMDMKRKITSGDLLGGIIIPSYFSRFVKEGEEIAPIFLACDGSQPNTAGFVKNYVKSAVTNVFLQNQEEDGKALSRKGVKIDPRFWFNEELNSHHFLIPGSIAIIMTLIGTILTALVVAREWERGTMEALMATPLTLSEIILGKLIPYFILGVLSMLLCTAIGSFLFAVPLRGSFILLFFVTGIFLLASLSLGLLVSSITRSQFNASQIAIVTAFLPAFMLSGFIFEISSMPKRIQILTYAIPARYMVSSLQTIFLVGNVPALIVKNSIAMGLFALILFTVMKCKLRKRLD